MASTGRGTIDNEDEDKSRMDADLVKRLRQRERRKKTREGLRFMRNVAIQVRILFKWNNAILRLKLR